MSQQPLLESIENHKKVGGKELIASIEGGTPIAALTFQLMPLIAEERMMIYIDNIYVMAEHRGKGVLSRMFKFLKAYCSEQYPGFDSCNLLCEKENEAARKVYLHMGFYKTHTQAFHYYVNG